MTTDASEILDPEDANGVVRGYQLRIAQYGATSASLNSGSTEKQRIRHQVHASSLSGACPAVLDIGCGLGDFYHYLKEQGQGCQYTGFDIVPEYIVECRRRYPEASFQKRDIFREPIEGFYDTIIMSQVLNNNYARSDNLRVMRTALSLAFEHTRASVSVDMMSTYVDFQIPELFYYSPEEIFRFAKSITRRVRLRHDYRPFEFCIQLFHEDARDYVP